MTEAPPRAPPRRGPGVAVTIALLVVGFLISTTVAVVEYVQLRAARQEISELREQGADGDEGGGFLEGLFEGVGDLVEGLGGDLGGLFGGDQGVVGCIQADALEPGTAGDPGGTPQQRVAAISEQVEDLRGLEFEEPVEAEFLDAAGVGRRIRRLLLDEYSEEVADAEERILGALGAVPRGTDLREVRAQALEGQVAGFYVPETGELVIRIQGGEISALDRATLAHELEHALADQSLDLPVPEEYIPGSEDADLAALAVVEGDATLTQQRYAVGLSLQDQLGLLDPSVIAQAEAGLGALPHYLQRELLFPYEDGLKFVCELYGRGGWDAVNGAYARPPTTTAQILFPDRFHDREAGLDPRDPGELRRPWRRVQAQQFGAANLLWLFQAPGGQISRALDSPLVGAGAWAGGEVHLYTAGRRTAVGVSLLEREGEDVLCSAMSHWYAQAFPQARPTGSATGRGLLLDDSAQDAVLRCVGDEIRLGVGPDAPTARALVR